MCTNLNLSSLSKWNVALSLQTWSTLNRQLIMQLVTDGRILRRSYYLRVFIFCSLLNRKLNPSDHLNDSTNIEQSLSFKGESFKRGRRSCSCYLFHQTNAIQVQIETHPVDYRHASAEPGCRATTQSNVLSMPKPPCLIAWTKAPILEDLLIDLLKSLISSFLRSM